MQVYTVALDTIGRISVRWGSRPPASAKRYVMKIRTTKAKEKLSRDPGSRWTPKLVEGGWTPVSDLFLQHYADMYPDITSMQAMLIIHLINHKWDKNAPYPGFETLAKRMGISATQVRNHARALEKNGYLERELRVSNTNKFHLQKLFKKLEAHAAANPGKTKKKEDDDE